MFDEGRKFGSRPKSKSTDVTARGPSSMTFTDAQNSFDREVSAVHSERFWRFVSASAWKMIRINSPTPMRKSNSVAGSRHAAHDGSG
jgi:hypothetical protein